MKTTIFKNRQKPSKNDDELSWMKGYNQAFRDLNKNLTKRIKMKQ